MPPGGSRRSGYGEAMDLLRGLAACRVGRARPDRVLVRTRPTGPTPRGRRRSRQPARPPPAMAPLVRADLLSPPGSAPSRAGAASRSRPTTSTRRPRCAAVRHLAGTIGPREATGRALRTAPPTGWRPRSNAGWATTWSASASTYRQGCRGRCAGPGGSLGERRRDAARLRPDRAAPRRRRAPRHGAAGAGRGGQRVGGRGDAGGRPRPRPSGVRACRSCSSRSVPRSRAGRRTTTTTTARGPTSPRCSAAERGRAAGHGVARPGRRRGERCRSARPATATRCSAACSRRRGAWASPAVADLDQRSSDHWSFVRAGLPGARLGSTPYAAYHDASDVPSVVSPAQLERVGRIVLAWLAPR